MVSFFILFFVILLFFDAISGIIFRFLGLLGQFWTIFTLFRLWYRLTSCGLVILAVVSNYFCSFGLLEGVWTIFAVLGRFFGVTCCCLVINASYTTELMTELG